MEDKKNQPESIIINNEKQNTAEINTGKKEKKFFENSVVLIIVIGLIALAIRLFVFQPYIVSGQSMEPNYHDNEYMLVEKISGYSKNYHRGDVVVFKNPNNTNEVFLKRVIGLPGEKIQIDKNDIKIYNNKYPGGIALQEDYLSKNLLPKEYAKANFSLENNQYFLMGDNRGNSIDSRIFGPVDENLIIGKTWLEMNGFLNFEKILTPEYSFL